MAITLPPLPYADDALDPHITAHTISFHYGKHHAGYVTNLNGMIEGTGLADATLEEIIDMAEPGGLFNNAAQIWNHTFYWESMAPNGGGTPTGELAAAIDRSFGSYQAFREQFTADAVGNFGLGVDDGCGMDHLLFSAHNKSALATTLPATVALHWYMVMFLMTFLIWHSKTS